MARPSKYKPEYCERLVSHMSRGLSFESFGGEIGVCKETLRSWAKDHPEFLAAKKIGRATSLVFWERLGIKAINGEIENFNAAAWIFNMKNRFGWRDRKDIAAQGAIDLNVRRFEKMPQEELMLEAEAQLKRLKGEN